MLKVLNKCCKRKHFQMTRVNSREIILVNFDNLTTSLQYVFFGKKLFVEDHTRLRNSLQTAEPLKSHWGCRSCYRGSLHAYKLETLY